VNLWTWGGQYVGYRDGDELWTHRGKHVGHFHGDEVYGPDGRYLGEVKSNDRLITSRSKGIQRQSSFRPYADRVGTVPRVNYVGNVMLVGYEDFPDRTAA
jgi:hypothetical protein